MNPYTQLVTDLMGTKLKTPYGEEIGVVQNVMINPTDGTIVFIILCFANFIGKVHRHFAIPRQKLMYKKEDARPYFEIDEDMLKNATKFNVNSDSQIHSHDKSQHILELISGEETGESRYAL